MKELEYPFDVEYIIKNKIRPVGASVIANVVFIFMLLLLSY